MWLEIFVTYYDRRIKGLIKMLHPTEKVISLVKYACKWNLKTPSHEWVQNFPNLKEKSSCNKHFDWLLVLITQILNKIFWFAIDNCQTKKESNECNGTIWLHTQNYQPTKPSLFNVDNFNTTSSSPSPINTTSSPDQPQLLHWSTWPHKPPMNLVDYHCNFFAQSSLRCMYLLPYVLTYSCISSSHHWCWRASW